MVFISDKILSRKASWPDREMTDKAKSTSFTSCDKKRIPRKKRRVRTWEQREGLTPCTQGSRGRSNWPSWVEIRVMVPVGPCSDQCAHIVSRDSHNCISGKMRVWLHLSLADMFYLNL